MIPDFDQYVEYKDDSGIHPVMMDQLPLSNPLSLAVIGDGYAQMATGGGRSRWMLPRWMISKPPRRRCTMPTSSHTR